MLAVNAENRGFSGGTGLRRVAECGRGSFETAYDGFQQLSERFEQKRMKEVSNVFPQAAFDLQFFPGGLEQGATALLRLIHQESQHHQESEDHR